MEEIANISIIPIITFTSLDFFVPKIIGKLFTLCILSPSISSISLIISLFTLIKKANTE